MKNQTPTDLEPQITAQPKSSTIASPDEGPAMEFGEMNEQDARDSGYIGANGRAVDKAKPDVEGIPTGAWTDLGHGRSGVVKKH